MLPSSSPNEPAGYVHGTSSVTVPPLTVAPSQFAGVG
jgi:hypothetical protein